MKHLQIFYLWSFKPKEKSEIPNRIITNNNNFIPYYTIIEPHHIQPLIASYHITELYNLIPDTAWVVKSDLARLIYIYYFGGVYLDADCSILKDFTVDLSAHQIILFEEHFVEDTDKLGHREIHIPLRICNYAFASFTPKHPFFKAAIDEAINRLKTILIDEQKDQLTSDEILWVCGPDVLSTVYHFKQNEFGNIKILDRSYLNHECHGSWRRSILYKSFKKMLSIYRDITSYFSNQI